MGWRGRREGWRGVVLLQTGDIEDMRQGKHQQAQVPVDLITNTSPTPTDNECFLSEITASALLRAGSGSGGGGIH